MTAIRTYSPGRLAIRALAALALASAWLSAAVAWAPQAAAHAADGSDTHHAVHLASPAVVRIVLGVSGHVTCIACLNGQTVREPSDGSEYAYAFSGSGAFISPDGYIMTADHVVDPDSARFAVVDAAISDFAQQAGISQDAATKIFEQADSNGQLDYSSVQITDQRVYLSTDYTGQLQSAGEVISYPIQRIAASSPIDQQDTAIIKVDAQDMPFLQLAAASEVNVQDTVTAVAYPGDADPTSGSDNNSFDQLLDPSATSATTLNNLLTPTVETGSIIAQKTVTANTAAYETTGISNHGSSGGAVINSDGKIVGFVDRFSSTDSDRVTILVASSVVAKYAAQAGVPAAPTGQFMTQWSKAITEYDTPGACRYTNAARDLQQLAAQYPKFAAVKQYAQDAQAKITPSDCPAPASQNRGLLYGVAGGGGLLAAIVVGLLVWLVRRGKRPAPAPAVVHAGGYGMPAAPSVPLGPGQMPPMGQSGGQYGAYAPPSVPLTSAYPGTAAPPSVPLTGYPGYPGYLGTPAPTQAAYGPTTPPQSPGFPGAPYQPYAPQPQQFQSAPGGYGQQSFPSGVTEAQAAPAPGYGQSGVQQPFSSGAAYGQAPLNPAYPAYGQPPAQSAQPAAQPTQAYCANGHAVPDPAAQFCPFCGGIVLQQPQ